jgi:hypothetical protein
MVATRASKLAAVDSSNPLHDTSILGRVCGYVGPGYWLLCGAVCRKWKAVYAGVADQKMRSFSLTSNNKLVICGNRSTLYSAAIASPATVRLAIRCGLAIRTNDQLQLIAGLHANMQTLAVLQEPGMPVTENLVKAVALSGRLSILQFLVVQLKSPKPITLSYFAAHGGSIDMLDWLKMQGWCVFDAYTCAGAAEGGHLAALQHLRSRGCPWNGGSIPWEAASSGSIELIE